MSETYWAIAEILRKHLGEAVFYTYLDDAIDEVTDYVDKHYTRKPVRKRTGKKVIPIKEEGNE